MSKALAQGLTADVGTHQANHQQDVALVKAMLNVVRNKHHHPFLHGSLNEFWDGHVAHALKAFQIEAGTAAPPPPHGHHGNGSHHAGHHARGAPAAVAPAPPVYPDTLGVLKPGSATWNKLVEQLPTSPHDFTRLAVLPDSTVVYLRADVDDRNASIDELADQPLDPEFRNKVVAVVRAVYDKYGIVLRGWTTNPTYSSYRRDFDAQLQVYREKHSNAGPGEGDHNFGEAVDLGFPGLQWVGTFGAVHEVRVQEDKHHHLRDWEHRPREMRKALLKARNALVEANGLFTITAWNGWDPFHVQAYRDGQANPARSLVAHLGRVNSGMRWKVGHTPHPRAHPPDGDVTKGPHYLCDLGLADLPENHFADLGTAPQIWGGSLTLKELRHKMAKARGAATKKHVHDHDVPEKDVKDLREQIHTVFRQADLGWQSWQPVP
jgi:hypothetical protein